MSLLFGQIKHLTRTVNPITQITNALRTASINPSIPLTQKVDEKTLRDPVDRSSSASSQNIIQKINEQLVNKAEGRLFAVVQLCGKQFKVTSGDIILIEGHWPPTIGDKIRLEKVLLVGAQDFTLVGKPILPKSDVEVHATIVEKTLTHTKTHFKLKPRKQYKRINFYKFPNTMIRINSITVHGITDARNDTEGIDNQQGKIIPIF